MLFGTICHNFYHLFYSTQNENEQMNFVFELVFLREKQNSDSDSIQLIMFTRKIKIVKFTAFAHLNKVR